MRLSIVLPTFNEKDNIVPLVEKLTSSLAEAGFNDYEMLFVDDSNDETPKVIQEQSAKDARIRLIKGDHQGLAQAFIKGFKEAQGKYIGCMDTDLQHPPNVMSKLLKKAQENKADIVTATRYAKGGSAKGLGSLKTFYGWYRRAVSLGMKYFTQILFIPTRKTSDPLGGCFLFKKSILEGIELQPKGFKILVEVLMRAKYKKVSEVPYTFLARENDDSKATLSQGLEFFGHLWYIFRTMPEAARFLKFCLVGGSGVFVNLGTLYLCVEFLNTGEKLGWLFAIVVSILSNYILNTIFTYGDKRSKNRKESLRRVTYYYIISFATMFFNYAIYSLGLSLEIHYILSELIAIALATVLNFVLLTKLVWGMKIRA